MLKNIAIAALLAASAAQAANFFPLSPGNHWTYRSASGETFEIAVGLNPIATTGRLIYHKVTGYATQPLYVRQGDNGVIYWLNQDTGREQILTDFRPLPGAYYNTVISAPCDQDAQAQERPVALEGAGGVFPEAREIRYRVLDCADTGVESELYLDNIGLARRVNQTIAGPREFNLVSAKVGSMTLSAAPGVDFRVSLSTAAVNRDRDEPVNVEVTLRLSVDRLDAVHLRYTTSQRYDIAVKDQRGETVFLWSAAALFLPMISEEDVISKEYSESLTLQLPDGRYQVEAWLTTDARERQFAGVAPLSIFTKGPIPAATKHIRTRAPR
jgi:hypothetical protein